MTSLDPMRRRLVVIALGAFIFGLTALPVSPQVERYLAGYDNVNRHARESIVGNMAKGH